LSVDLQVLGSDDADSAVLLPLLEPGHCSPHIYADEVVKVVTGERAPLLPDQRTIIAGGEAVNMGDTTNLAQETYFESKGGSSLKLRIAFALCLALVALPTMAQTIYDNGPINGTTDAWTINSGFVVSDTFTTDGSQPITGLVFGAWAFPGDVLESAEISITSSEFGGTTYFDGVVNFTQSGCSGNQFGFNVCTETGLFSGPQLSEGSYWLNLQNAVVNSGDPIYWDENSGPSSASENSVGTIPSEAFTVLGATTTSTTTGTIPEPSSIMLVGSGLLGLAGFLRRKLF
jgi:PEP-CTERM motif